jgi:hypothetical protein
MTVIGCRRSRPPGRLQAPPYQKIAKMAMIANHRAKLLTMSLLSVFMIPSVLI